jgi:hypothetical protein
VYYARLKDAVAELVFAMCDSDAALLGYGNVTGFLFNQPPPAASADKSAAVAAAAGDMFVLFARLERNGDPREPEPHAQGEREGGNRTAAAPQSRRRVTSQLCNKIQISLDNSAEFEISMKI